MNALYDCILDFNPGYAPPETEKKNGIYFHQQPAIKRLIELGEYNVSAYVGETDPIRDLKRFKDGDYSKLPEKVVADEFLKVHPELSDHYIRAFLYSKGCRKTDLGGSPEVVLAPLWIKTYEQFINFLRDQVRKLSEKFYEQERVYGFTPESHVKKMKEKNPEAVRAPKLPIVVDLINNLKDKPKDAKIYVPMDAFAHFNITLHNLGYSNVYTDQEYDMSVGLGYIPETINLITQDEYKSMKFDVIIGNPPYGNQGMQAIEFLAEAGNRIKDDGVIMLILPASIRKESSQNKLTKRNAYLECVDDSDLPSDAFPASITAVKQTWVKSETPREKIETTTSHPDFKFLNYNERFNADLFVGRIGGGPCGKVKTKDFTHYAPGHYFLKASSQQVIDNMLTLQDKFIAKSKEGSNGRRSLSKHELVTIYKENFDVKESSQSESRFFD